MAHQFDIIVVGGGPGGYVAAIRGAQLGLSVALVEDKHLGGVCLNWGCIPTKSLLRCADVYHTLQHAEDFGIKAKGLSIDLPAMVKRSRDTAAKLAEGVAYLMKKNKITVFDGRGRLSDQPHTLIVTDKDGDTQTLTSPHIILATGARARVLPGMEPDGDRIWTAQDAMTPKKLPKSLVVVGSGAIGMEFASFYSTLGTQVTVLERLDRILPAEDEEISALAQKIFKNQGIAFETGVTVTGIEKSKNKATVSFTKGAETHTIDGEHVIMAVGVVGNTQDLGLDHTNVKVAPAAHIVTNDHNETDQPGVYAIGDVAGGPWLAHKASHEGVLCVERIAGHTVHLLQKNRIPGCTYCRPQVASLGLTEQAALDAGLPIKVGRFDPSGNGKSLALGETDGLIKTIFHQDTGELLGAHMIGAEVTELIQTYGVAQTLETTEKDLMHTIFAHPTLSEMLHESVLDAFGQSLHK
jgi:dihydrolipoamide dehydrogenase